MRSNQTIGKLTVVEVERGERESYVPYVLGVELCRSTQGE